MKPAIRGAFIVSDNGMTLEVDTIDLATIIKSVFEYVQASDIYEHLYIGQDNLFGGVLRLSVHIAASVQAIVDFEEYDDGVFSYDHLENFGESLPNTICKRITLGEWYNIAENHEVPEWLDEHVTRYFLEKGVAVREQYQCV
ncbi:hypothetical protein VPH49_21835 [Pseudomonas luteola]|uniref:hypothetical protein n=1 Tax=Pseudomonas luteola TaxID=47886 RepID=UPI003A83885C